jgi:branched-chain amino acid aminotransferase
MQSFSSSKIWLNGMLVTAEAARVDPADRGLLLGDGLFETLRVAESIPRHMARHLARLEAGACLLRLDPPDVAELHQALAAVIAAQGLVEGTLRLTMTRGPGPRGVLPPRSHRPTVLITAAPLPPPAGPADVIIARSIRRDENSPLSGIKSLNYLPSILARLEAEERGAADALLLNQAGLAAESSAATIFLHRSGEWLTPRLQDGALPGIRRAVLLEAGLVREAELPAAWLFEAEALCLGNALNLRPIKSVDGHAIGGRNVFATFAAANEALGFGWACGGETSTGQV